METKYKKGDLVVETNETSKLILGVPELLVLHTYTYNSQKLSKIVFSMIYLLILYCI